MQRADVRDVAAAFAQADEQLTAMKLQKLVYYVQAWHLARFGAPAFEDEVQAWAQGPVIRRLYALHQGMRKVSGLLWGDAGRLPVSVHDVVDLVRERYGSLSAEELSRISHRELPWRHARAGLPEGAVSAAAIPSEVMRDFYRRQRGDAQHAMDDVLATMRLEGLEPTPEGRVRLEAVAKRRMPLHQAMAETLAAYRR